MAGLDARGVAVAWVRAVMDDRDLRAAWPLTDADLRLVLVQHWILSRGADDVVGSPDGWETLASRLAACPPTSMAWETFAAERLKRWRLHWVGFNSTTWDLRDEPETPAPDVEVVTFIEPGQKLRTTPGPPIVYRRLAVRRRDDGWRVAGLDGTTLFRPGWPPTPG